MTKHLLWTFLALALAAPVLADQMLVFKKDSPYKGAAMRIASYERKGGKLIIQGVKGDTFSASDGSVDWELSKKATEKLHGTQDAEATRRAEDERARKSGEASRNRKPLSLVEASRRYGVDKPAMSVVSGTAVHEVEAQKGSGEEGKGGPGAGGGSSSDTPEVKAARDKLAALKADRDKLVKEIETLKADTNTDPLSAQQRESRLKDRQAQLSDLDKKVQAAEDVLNKAIADAAAKAKAAAEKAAASSPAEKPAGEKPPDKAPAGGK